MRFYEKTNQKRINNLTVFKAKKKRDKFSDIQPYQI